MKKSTILLLVVFYIAAFFVVGLLGMQIRSHYQVSYVNEFIIKPMEDMKSLNLKIDDKQTKTETFGDAETDPTHVRTVHEYVYKPIKYREGLTLKFEVEFNPQNTSLSDYVLHWKDTTTLYKVTKDDIDKTIFVTDIQKPGRLATNIEFTIEDLQANGVKSSVKIIVTP